MPAGACAKGERQAWSSGSLKKLFTEPCSSFNLFVFSIVSLNLSHGTQPSLGREGRKPSIPRSY